MSTCTQNHSPQTNDVLFVYDGLGIIKCIVADMDVDGSPIVIFRNPITASGFVMDTLILNGECWSTSGEWDEVPTDHPYVAQYKAAA